MKGFTRSDLFFSLCGLNCGLCTMHVDGHCPGGGGAGNQSCKLARCSLAHGEPEYCSQCQEFPCKSYEKIDESDSFITHYNQKKDLKKQEEAGAEAYQREQKEKTDILSWLLENYNDGRKKSFFCLAVNLLELQELRRIRQQISQHEEINRLTIKEKAAFVSRLLQDQADKNQIVLKLRRKKRQT